MNSNLVLFIPRRFSSETCTRQFTEYPESRWCIPYFSNTAAATAVSVHQNSLARDFEEYCRHFGPGVPRRFGPGVEKTLTSAHRELSVKGFTLQALAERTDMSSIMFGRPRRTDLVRKSSKFSPACAFADGPKGP